MGPIVEAIESDRAGVQIQGMTGQGGERAGHLRAA